MTVLTGLVGVVLVQQSLERYAFVELHMGGEVSLQLYASSEEVAEKAARAAFDRFADLEQKMSDYRPSSEIRVAQEAAVGEWVRVSSDLFTVLKQGKRVSALTDGAFDMTAGPYIGLWREARQTGRSPSYVALQEAREKVGWRFVELDEGRRAVRIAREGVRIDLGGIAKGYACDEALEAMRRFGVRSASMVAGGDLKVGDAPPGEEGWPVRVAGESEIRFFENVAVSTSGDTEQFVEIWGVRYSHIVDPRHGFGVSNRIQATVVAEDGLTTDPLATALCVVGERGRSAVKRSGAKSWLKVVE